MKTYYENNHKIIQMTEDEIGPLTEDDYKMMEEAAKHPITYDEDCPELTDEQLANFISIKEFNRLERQKPILSLRVNRKTLSELQKFGKGYTSIAARILDKALQDKEFLKKCL